MIPIYLISCDKTSHILPTTIYLYKKFISPTPLIKILGFKKPTLPDWENVEFIQLAEEQESIYLWSKYIYDYFITIQDELIFLALDDFLPIDFINMKCYDYIISTMKQYTNFGLTTISQSIWYTQDRVSKPIKILESNDNFFIFVRDKNDSYNISLQPGIWNKNYLLDIFKHNYTPWEMEIKGSEFSKKLEYNNLSTSYCPSSDIKCLLPYSYVSALSKQWTPYINVQGLCINIINELIDKNLIKEDIITIGCPLKKILYIKNITTNQFIKNLHTINDNKINEDLFFKKYY